MYPFEFKYKIALDLDEEKLNLLLNIIEKELNSNFPIRAQRNPNSLSFSTESIINSETARENRFSALRFIDKGIFDYNKTQKTFTYKVYNYTNTILTLIAVIIIPFFSNSYWLPGIFFTLFICTNFIIYFGNKSIFEDAITKFNNNS